MPPLPVNCQYSHTEVAHTEQQCLQAHTQLCEGKLAGGTCHTCLIYVGMYSTTRRVLIFFFLTCDNEDLSDVRYIMNGWFEFVIGEEGSEEEKGILFQTWTS